MTRSIVGDPVVKGTIQLLKGHGLDHRESHRVSINKHVSCQTILEMDPEYLQPTLILSSWAVNTLIDPVNS